MCSKDVERIDDLSHGEGEFQVLDPHGDSEPDQVVNDAGDKPRHRFGDFKVPDRGVVGWEQWGENLIPGGK